jgi:hypothetical protein
MSDKQQQWLAIQEQTPALAAWLIEMNKLFGKPAALRVEFPSGLVVASGIFRHPRTTLH